VRREKGALPRLRQGPSVEIKLSAGAYGQPWAYWLMKQVKSSTFSTGAIVLPSQLE
jgi:hypothetical protein